MPLGTPSQAYGTLSYRVSNPLKSLPTIYLQSHAPLDREWESFGLGRSSKLLLNFRDGES